MIRHLEVDGVPTVLAPTAGPMRAGLIFRVGHADEILSRNGITHLVEHLVLHPLAHGDYHHNGTTGTTATSFHAQGTATDVAAFLTGVCTSLADLPLARLEIEKDVLRTEAAGRADGVAGPLGVWRHGARDHGLPGYPEWGLSALGPDDLRAWVARYFTRDNAVLWIAGPDVPAGLTLKLPAGARQAVPPPSSALTRTPAFFPGGARAVAWNSVVPRSAAASVLTEVLERVMFRELRQETGLSYTVQTDYEPRGDGMAVVTAMADALPEKTDAVLGAFVDVLALIRVGRIDPADVAAVLENRQEMLGNAEIDAARLPGYARDLLNGEPVQSTESLRAEFAALGVDDVVAAGRGALDGGLLMTPGGRSAEWAGFAPAPATSEQVVTGTAYPAIGAADRALVLGEQGVSITGTADEQVTVRFDACSAVLAYPDGGRLLVGHDGIMLRFEPTLYQGLPAAIPWLDARVPRTAGVMMPARDPQSIPQPRQPTKPSAAPRERVGRGKLLAAGLFTALAALFFAFLTLGMALAIRDDPTDLASSLVVLVFGVAVGGYFGWISVKSLRAAFRSGG